jgi:hypothetical protein
MALHLIFFKIHWIYNYLCSQLMLWVRISISARFTTLCDNVCQWLATGRWFSPGPSVSSTNKTDRHDITEILLKVALNTIKQTKQHQNTTKRKKHLSLKRTNFVPCSDWLPKGIVTRLYKNKYCVYMLCVYWCVNYSKRTKSAHLSQNKSMSAFVPCLGYSKYVYVFMRSNTSTGRGLVATCLSADLFHWASTNKRSN